MCLGVSSMENEKSPILLASGTGCATCHFQLNEARGALVKAPEVGPMENIAPISHGTRLHAQVARRIPEGAAWSSHFRLFSEVRWAVEWLV